MLCMAAIGNAQEKKGGLRLEAGLGSTSFGNYPAVSVFADPEQKYSMIPSEQITFGYRTSYNIFYGLTVGSRGGHTSFIAEDEVFFDIDLMADFRLLYPIGHRMELEIGVACGLLFHGNAYEMDQSYSYSRKGISGRFSAGINYLLSPKSYVGLRVQCPYTASLWGDDPELPAFVQSLGYTATSRQLLNGYGIHFTWGICF